MTVSHDPSVPSDVAVPPDRAPDQPPTAPAPLAVATAYARRGWAVIPIPHGQKNPGFKGWEQARLAKPDLPAHFNG